MVIEVIPYGAIPYKCGICGTVYLWKPSLDDMDEVRCPVCKARYSHECISSFRYKLIRAFSKRVERGSDIE